jgi:hypothetical protein
MRCKAFGELSARSSASRAAPVWRIALGSDGADELHLLMSNIAPDGTVYPAVETRLARRNG